jgi:hypothetical protein
MSVFRGGKIGLQDNYLIVDLLNIYIYIYGIAHDEIGEHRIYIIFEI